MLEEYSFDTYEDDKQNKIFVLIIYDIVDNRKRNKLAKYLQGYGNRVQKSAFEATISKKKYDQLLREIPAFIGSADSIRIYRISGKGQVIAWGIQNNTEQEDIILV